MNKKIFSILAILLLLSFSCTKDTSNLLNDGLSDSDIIAGLKDALKVGTDTSVATVSKVDGYFADQTIKIFLPPEAAQIVAHKDDVPGLSILVDSMVLKLNRAAEDAASSALPIFVNAITSMTISDGINILHGSDTAATNYLRQTTYVSLRDLFQPKINTSLNKPIIGVSANDMWNSVTGLWNPFASSVAGQLLGYQPVNITLSEYTTGKALYGLFLKIGNEEKDIRKDPVARVDDILKKVFGSSN